jgi:16S rRNA (guanine966-N2)-methyltransferase
MGFRAKTDNRLRIIGGKWRSRRLNIPALDNLRPTPDRVRETLFNWLAPAIDGAHCLDLFAGSGALGIEALSRGAARAVFVERHPIAVRYLRENLNLLGIGAPQVEQADAMAWLRGSPRAFDVVFLDPPFRKKLIAPVCRALEQGGWLTPAARIYLETERGLEAPGLPETWEIVREKTAGEVMYRLVMTTL